MRGALIVFEGGDRCGKTTQCKRIVSLLKEQGTAVEFISFPDRSLATGKVINDYLTRKIELPDKAVHLLFSANRWELVPKMKNMLLNGTSLIVDRYSFSGVAFSAAKKGMSFEWCKEAETGLPKPDKVFLLKLGLEVMKDRSGWGNERYENNDFQFSVAKNYQQLYDESYWMEINGDKSIEALTTELLPYIHDTIEIAKTKPLTELW